MIVTHIMGGMGNQLFQYAVGRCLAYKNQTDLKLEISECESQKNSRHAYYQLKNFNIQENFTDLDKITGFKQVNEKNNGVFDPEIFKVKGDIFLYGYWQNEKYFKDIEDILRKELTPKNPFGEKSSFWKEKILSAECAVSLHIRHGDYLNPLIRYDSGVLPLDYYFDCVNELKKISKNLTIFVFSDDLNWAKNNFKLDVPVEYIEGCEKDVDELFLMSFCKHNIMANSTFSWWGAWLNQNPDKKVFVPQRIRNTDKRPTYYFNLPKRYTEISVDHNKNPHVEFPPTLSVILHVADDKDANEITLSSILSQSFNDYELIIIDSSTNGCEKICRRFAENKNISIIKENRSVEKLAAWNKGLECARGYYVMFMTVKNFIISQTVQVLDQLLYEYLKIYKNAYVTYENYHEVYPKIICLTKFISEDADGNLIIDELKNKKFSIKNDERFKEIQGMAEISINDRDKMILLATNQINNLLGTKFFKRNFLNENKICFNESMMNRGGGSAELKFLTDAFLQTEKITFIPQVFYGRLN